MEDAPDWESSIPSDLQQALAEPLDENDDFGLHHPLYYAFSTWRRYRDHGLLPAAGGYDDQVSAWIADVNALDGRYHIHWEAARKAHQDEHAPRR